MPKEQWGVKRLCPTTGKRFYDLNKTPVVSPYTGEIVSIDTNPRKGSSAHHHAEAAKHKVVAPQEVDNEDALLDDDDVAVEADDDLLEDEDDDTVSFDELSDVAGDEEDV